MKRQISQQEINEIKIKVSKYLNIILTIVSISVVIISIFLLAGNVISGKQAGVIIPAALLVYLIMGVLSNRFETRKAVMAIYITLISICAIVLFIFIVLNMV